MYGCQSITFGDDSTALVYRPVKTSIRFVRAPGELSGLGVSHSISSLYGAFVWEGRALNSPNRWLLARAVMYLKGSGNKQDVIINTCFVAAATCRVIGGFGIGSAYLTCCAILCINLLLCSFRLLHMFSINRRMGQLLIIIIKIMHTDVTAFLLFSVVLICGFEISAFFFSWVLVPPRHLKPWTLVQGLEI
jgi:hypothetical protein